MIFMRTADVVVITGASAGVGRATAWTFAKRGARIGLLARGREGLDATCREVQELGGKALVIPTDVADADQVEAAAARVERELGPIRVWVNNAMATVFSPVKETSPEEFKRSTEVTYLGAVYGTMAALKHMLPRDTGSIIQVGSALVYRSIPLQAAYCGAKHGLKGFTDSLRTELLHDGSRIHLTMVQLPALNTPQFSWSKTRMPRHPQPVPPIFQPEVAAAAIVWAAYHKRREVYVGMPTVKAIWGQKFIPGLLDRYLARIGYETQQTSAYISSNRADNLFAPVQGDHGAHGVFDSRAQAYSPQLWLTKNRNWIMMAAAALALLRRRRGY
jgi:NAD(P)-dependent dehydrogenase (short-subunit alcohol dehydrogenase family)